MLQAYLTSYYENSSLITVDDYANLIKLWSDYDPKALGLIDPQDVAFLVHELVDPLGKAEEYQDIMKDIVAENENADNKSKGALQKD